MATLSMQYRPRTTRSLAIATGKRETSSALSSPVAIERLRMAPDRFHEPALAREIVDLFSGLPSGVVVDATLGGAGHALAILESAPQLRLLGIDRDELITGRSENTCCDIADRSCFWFPSRFCIIARGPPALLLLS